MDCSSKVTREGGGVGRKKLGLGRKEDGEGGGGGGGGQENLCNRPGPQVTGVDLTSKVSGTEGRRCLLLA